MSGVFVTGTDTGVGKTLVAAILVRALTADYFKPLQTGIDDEPQDASTVSRLAGLAASRLHPSAYVLRAALSPAAAAAAEGIVIDPGRLSLPQSRRTIVVEGAGGVLVPVAPGVLMVDLMRRFALPVLVVARSGLGTINHTLLSLEALRSRGLVVAGVVMSGPPNAGNRSAIEQRGQVPVLAELPVLPAVDAATVAKVAAQWRGWLVGRGEDTGGWMRRSASRPAGWRQGWRRLGRFDRVRADGSGHGGAGRGAMRPTGRRRGRRAARRAWGQNEAEAGGEERDA